MTRVHPFNDFLRGYEEGKGDLGLYPVNVDDGILNDLQKAKPFDIGHVAGLGIKLVADFAANRGSEDDAVNGLAMLSATYKTPFIPNRTVFRDAGEVTGRAKARGNGRISKEIERFDDIQSTRLQELMLRYVQLHEGFKEGEKRGMLPVDYAKLAQNHSYTKSLEPMEKGMRLGAAYSTLGPITKSINAGNYESGPLFEAVRLLYNPRLHDDPRLPVAEWLVPMVDDEVTPLMARLLELQLQPEVYSIDKAQKTLKGIRSRYKDFVMNF